MYCYIPRQPGLSGLTPLSTIYRVTDTAGNSDTAIVTVQISPTFPQASDIVDIVDLAVPTTTLDVLSLATDPNGDPLVLHRISQPANGTAAIDDNGTPTNATDDRIVYTPTMGFAGGDSFTFTVCDTVGFCDVATITLEVPQPLVPLGVCIVQVQPLADTSNSGEDIEPEHLEPRLVITPTTLTTPLFNDTVAGTAIAVAATSGPGEGLTVTEIVRINIANGATGTSPMIIENAGLKTELLSDGDAHTVVTSDGLILEIPEGAISTTDTLEIETIDAANAPQPLPGTSVSSPRRLSLASGQTVISAPMTLRLPYADVDHDGVVDDTAPAITEGLLTLWRYVAADNMWVQIANTQVLFDANQVLGDTAELSIFGLFRVATGSASALALSSDRSIQGPTLGTPTSTTLSTVSWLTIGTTSATPFVVAWDTTALADGPYNLRAICAQEPITLTPFQTEAPGTNMSGGSGSSNCFIAIAAYGSPLEPQVQLLRSFRDTYLLPSDAGRWLVDQYYRLSPPIADLIRTHDRLRAVVQAILTPVVWIVGMWMHSGVNVSWGLLLMTTLLASLGWITRRVWSRR